MSDPQPVPHEESRVHATGTDPDFPTLDPGTDPNDTPAEEDEDDVEEDEDDKNLPAAPQL